MRIANTTAEEVRPQWNWLNIAVSSVLVICALATTALVARRELMTQYTSGASTKVAALKYVENWRSDLARGVRMGSPRAAVQMLELADFECPYCRSMHGLLQSVRAKHPDSVALTFVHYPLAGHRFAVVAARAAECAEAQDRFEAMHDQLFLGQESFGQVPWSEFAAKASVPDIAGFEQCMKAIAPIPRLDAGKALGQRLGLIGTPTLIINGWMLSHPPNLEELERMIDNVTAGKPAIPKS